MSHTLWEQWRAQRQELQAQLPQSHAYLLIDAAQLPLNCMPWKDMVAAGEVFNLLGKQPEGSHPEVCALLVPDAALWTDALVASHIERRPFAFMLLHSYQSHQQLGAILARATVVKLPRRRKGLLRFYDAAVFDYLQSSLSVNNFQQLLSCAQTWTYVDRSARMQTAHYSGARPGWALSPLLLSDAELHSLQLNGSPQRITAQLKKNGHLCVNANPFDTYAKLQLLIDALPPLADNGSRDALLYRCSALSLQQSLSAWSSHVPAIVQRHASDLQALGNAMMDWGQATSFDAIS
jgi:hypothetical protein